MAQYRDLVCRAIAEHRMLTFVYRGVKRKVIPAALGRHHSTGKSTLRAFELVGTRSRKQNPWKVYTVAMIRQMGLLDETFDGPPKGYTRGDKMLRSIYCQL